MKNLAIGILSIVCIACLVLCAMIWNDNRHLLKQMSEKATECAPKDGYRVMVDVCGRLSAINAQQNQYLQRVKGVLEESDEQRRKWGDGKVWRASGSRKDAGTGKGKRGVGGS